MNHTDAARVMRRKYTPFPISREDQEIFKFYKRMDASQWPTEDINFEKDREAYPSLPIRYKEIYKAFLAFFAPSDGLITEQALNFLRGSESAAEKMFLIAQLANEQVHSETYARSITEVLPESEWEEVFSEVDSIECVANKAKFVERWIDNVDASRGLRYLAGAFSEGTFFMSLFALVFFFRRKNLFPGFLTANSFIARDETLHRDFNAMMARRLGGFDTATAHAVANEAVTIELAHLRHILATPIDSLEIDTAAGLSFSSVEAFVKTLADQILQMAGVPTLFNVKAELPWMKDIGLTPHVSFYEAKVTSYSKLSVQSAMRAGKRVAIHGADDPEAVEF